MRIITICFFFLLFLFNKELSAQSVNIDSLLLKAESKKDTAKINAWFEICRLLLKKGNYEKADSLISELHSASNKINYKSGKGRACYLRSILTVILVGDYDLTRAQLDSALAIFNSVGDSVGMGFVYNNYSLIERRKGNYDSAIYHLERSRIIRENIGDRANLGGTYLNLSSVYLAKGNYKRSLESALKAAKIYEDLNAQLDLPGTYNNIALSYQNLKNTEQAVLFFNKAIDLGKKNNQLISLIEPSINLGTIYVDQKKYREAKESFEFVEQICLSTGNNGYLWSAYTNLGYTAYVLDSSFTKAMEYFNKALASIKVIGFDSGIGTVLIGRGEIYFLAKKYDLAEVDLLEAVRLSDSLGKNWILSRAYEYLLQIRKIKGDYKNALHYAKLLSAVNDSLMNGEILTRSNYLMVEYDDDKRRKEIALLEKEKLSNQLSIEATASGIKKQNTFLIITSGLSFLGLVSFFVIKRKRKYKQKLNHLLKLSLDSLEKKNDRIRESIVYAGRIKHAISASSKSLNTHFSYFKMMGIEAPIGGDMFLVNEYDGKVLLTIGSVDQVGVPGALKSVFTQVNYQDIVVSHSLRHPNLILNLFSEWWEENKELIGETPLLSSFVLNKESHTISFASNQLDLYIINEKGVKMLKSENILADNGIQRKSFRLFSSAYAANDWLVLLPAFVYDSTLESELSGLYMCNNENIENSLSEILIRYNKNKSFAAIFKI